MKTKFAVISDTHGNFQALYSAVMDALKNGANGFIFLGDYGTDYLQMKDTLDLIRQLQQEFLTLHM